MIILFWNLRKNENSKLVSELLETNDIDVAVFSEYKSLSKDKVLEHTNYSYSFEEGFGGNNRIIAIHKSSIDMTIKREQSRYTIYSLDINGNKTIIAGVHLQSDLYQGANDRLPTLIELSHDILEQEKALKTHRTLIIGDFNTNPFSPEMINKTALNSVLFRDLIDDRDTDKYEGRYYKRFYNPMLMLLSEEKKVYGSHYYTSDVCTLHWHMLDQVLVRKELAYSLEDIRYLKRINYTKLVSEKGIPVKKYSDHLPLLVEVML